MVSKVTLARIRTAGIYIPLFTGTLSVIGSGSILWSILSRRSTKLKDPQHRILAMLSIFDVLYSLNKALMFLTYPRGLGVPTFGNDATCALQGFFTQFGYAAGTYNLVLSFYYYLIINKGMKKEDFAKCWEKILHGVVIICHLGFAFTGVAIGLFNPTPGFCYITFGPWGCKNDPNPAVACPFLDTAPYFYEAFAQGWIQLAYVGIIVTNLLIWLYVRRQENEMNKYKVAKPAQAQRSNELAEMEKKSSYARNVFIQSMLYVGAFFLSWSWATVFHLVAWVTGNSVAWLTLLINIFLPMQGFFNAFIYARPRYMRLKKQNKQLGFRGAIRLVFFPPKEDDKSSMRSRTLRENVSTFRSPSNENVNSDRSVGKDSGVFKSFLKSMKRRDLKSSPSTRVGVIDEEEARSDGQDEDGVEPKIGEDGVGEKSKMDPEMEQSVKALLQTTDDENFANFLSLLLKDEEGGGEKPKNLKDEEGGGEKPKNQQKVDFDLY